MHKTLPRRRAARPGVAYVLAMIYLLLFTVLAIGFCAASTMSVQIARNDKAAAEAQAAAESGMQFVRYHLGHLSLPAETSPADLSQTVTQLLAHELNGTANLNGHDLAVDGKVICIPAENEWSTIDPALGTKFRAEITTSGPVVLVRITGRGTNEAIARGIQIQFEQSPRAAGDICLVPDPGTYEEVSP